MSSSGKRTRIFAVSRDQSDAPNTIDYLTKSAISLRIQFSSGCYAIPTTRETEETRLGRRLLRINRLPPYGFTEVQALKLEARRRGEGILDFGMGNPDGPTPPHIVEKLIEAARNPRNHRYSASRGITKLRHAIAARYQRNYGVELDPETDAIVTIGSKEGLAHLALAMVSPGDVVLTPTPTYPIHPYSVIIAGGEVRGIPLRQDSDFFEDLMQAYRRTLPRPKMLILN